MPGRFKGSHVIGGGDVLEVGVQCLSGVDSWALR